MADNFENSFRQISDLLKQDGVLDSIKGILGDLGVSQDKGKNDEVKSTNGSRKTGGEITGNKKTGGETSGNKNSGTEMPGSKNSGNETAGSEVSKTSSEDMRFVLNMAKAISEYRNASDPGTNLLSAISPFLNSKRQKACSNCIKVLKMAKVYEYMKKNNEDLALP
jgi:hypothetical protein